MLPLKVPRFETSGLTEHKSLGAVLSDRNDDRIVAPNFAIPDKSKQPRFVGSDPTAQIRIVCKGRLVSLSTSEIEFIRSAANYVEIHVGGLSYRVRSTLKQFQNRLNPGTFLRIHRCTIVNVQHVKNCRPIRRGDSLLTLRNGRELVVSRKHREAQNTLRGVAQ